MPLPPSPPHSLERLSTLWAPLAARPKAGTTLEQVLDPEYWVNALADGRAQRFQEIRVIPEDAAFCVDLMFIDIDERRLWAKTKVLHLHWNDSDVERPAVKDGRLRAEWGGPVHKWRVMTADGNLVEKGFPSRDEADAYLTQYREQMAA